MWLTKRELIAKPRLQAALGTELRLTEVDVLLNTGKFERANDILQHIKKNLAKTNPPRVSDLVTSTTLNCSSVLRTTVKGQLVLGTTVKCLQRPGAVGVDVLEEEQLQHEKEVRAQARAQEKVQKKAEAQKKRDERATAAFARTTAAAHKKAAVQAAREAKNAQKQLEIQSRATIRQSQSAVKKGLSAQEL